MGVHGGLEYSGAERVVGLTSSTPICGSYPESQQREALLQAQAARAAVDAKRDNACLTQRAYALDEADLQTLLLARRQSLDAALGAVRARVDALRSRYRMLVDAHLIWGLAAE